MGTSILGKTVIGPNIVTDDLLFYMDAGNVKSYPGTGVDVTDISGNGYSIELITGTTYDSSNLGSFLLDGENDYIQVLGNSYSFISGMTYEALFNWDGSVVSGYAGLYIGDGRILINSAGRYLVQTGNGNFFSTESSGPVVANEWSHFLYTIDLVNDMEYIYHNSEEVGSLARTSQYNFPLNSFKIGWGSGLTTYYIYSGKISINKVYAKTFSQEEITQNYNAIRGRYQI